MPLGRLKAQPEDSLTQSLQQATTGFALAQYVTAANARYNAANVVYQADKQNNHAFQRLSEFGFDIHEAQRLHEELEAKDQESQNLATQIDQQKEHGLISGAPSITAISEGFNPVTQLLFTHEYDQLIKRIGPTRAYKKIAQAQHNLAKAVGKLTKLREKGASIRLVLKEAVKYLGLYKRDKDTATDFFTTGADCDGRGLGEATLILETLWEEYQNGEINIYLENVVLEGSEEGHTRAIVEDVKEDQVYFLDTDQLASTDSSFKKGRLLLPFETAVARGILAAQGHITSKNLEPSEGSSLMYTKEDTLPLPYSKGVKKGDPGYFKPAIRSRSQYIPPGYLKYGSLAASMAMIAALVFQITSQEADQSPADLQLDNRDKATNPVTISFPEPDKPEEKQEDQDARPQKEVNETAFGVLGGKVPKKVELEEEKKDPPKDHFCQERIDTGATVNIDQDVVRIFKEREVPPNIGCYFLFYADAFEPQAVLDIASQTKRKLIRVNHPGQGDYIISREGGLIDKERAEKIRDLYQHDFSNMKVHIFYQGYGSETRALQEAFSGGAITPYLCPQITENPIANPSTHEMCQMYRAQQPNWATRPSGDTTCDGSAYKENNKLLAGTESTGGLNNYSGLPLCYERNIISGPSIARIIRLAKNNKAIHFEIIDKRRKIGYSFISPDEPIAEMDDQELSRYFGFSADEQVHHFMFPGDNLDVELIVGYLRRMFGSDLAPFKLCPRKGISPHPLLSKSPVCKNYQWRP